MDFKSVFSLNELENIKNMVDFDAVNMTINKAKDELLNKPFSNGLKAFIAEHNEKAFTIKDVKFSGNKVIVFWNDDTKTIVTMDNEESKYDIEKAIMAATMKKLYNSFNKPSRKKSIDDELDKWVKKFNDLSEEEKEKIKHAISKEN